MIFYPLPVVLRPAAAGSAWFRCSQPSESELGVIGQWWHVVEYLETDAKVSGHFLLFEKFHTV
jgi:hypothetical protein